MFVPCRYNRNMQNETSTTEVKYTVCCIRKINTLCSAAVGAIVRSLTEPEDSDVTSKVLLSSIYHDVGRTLLLGCLDDDEFLGAKPGTYEEGTVGEAAYRLLVSLFGEPPSTVAARRKADPSMFECELQGKLRLFLELEE